MSAKTTYGMGRKMGYGQYFIVKETPSGKTTKMHCTDSQLWDDYTEDKVSQARLKRTFDFLASK